MIIQESGFTLEPRLQQLLFRCRLYKSRKCVVDVEMPSKLIDWTLIHGSIICKMTRACMNVYMPSEMIACTLLLLIYL